MFKRMTSLMTIVALSIATMIMPAQVAFADGPANKYTVDQAMEMAVAETNRQMTTGIDKMKMGRQVDTLTNTINNLMNIGILSFTDKMDKTDPLVDSITALRNGQETISEGEDLQREVVKDAVRTLYITIVKLERQEKMLNAQVAFNEDLLKLDRYKVKVGLMGSVDLEKNFNGYQKTIRQRDSLHIAIAKLYSSLKDLIGLSNEKVVILDDSFVQNTNLIAPTQISNMDLLQGKNLKIKMLNNTYKRSKDFYTGVYDRYPKGSDNIKDADLDLQKSELALKNAEDALAYKYETNYQQALDAYENALQKKKDHEIKSYELKIMEKKLKSGAASKYEYNGQKTATEAARLDAEVARIDYILAMNAVESALKGTN